MKQYRLVNNLTGWFTFLVAAFTYCMTVEPTASFWDCPEFITTAFKLEAISSRSSRTTPPRWLCAST